MNSTSGLYPTLLLSLNAKPRGSVVSTLSTADSSVSATTNSLTSDSKYDFITYLFHDFNAVKYFEKDLQMNEKVYVYEDVQIAGLDIYLVEQWVIDRKIGTVVATFTGNMESRIWVKKLTIQKKQSKNYPLKFQEYLHELVLNHSKIKCMDKNKHHECKTEPDDPFFALTKGSTNNLSEIATESEQSDAPNGTEEVCFITNLSSLPSNLNLIPIPGGDPREVDVNFTVNSNLKKLNCSGRSISLICATTSDASVDKFRQMYKIYNVNIPFRFAVRELVNVIQICLFYFDLLDAKYADGLLCSKTEEAIRNWWNLIGLPHFNYKPNSRAGILPSNSVAAIISLILSVRLRLNLIGGCDVPKDPFDFENFMLSIGQFQRQFKLEKKRKLDLETLSKLFSTTNAKLSPSKNSSTDFGGIGSAEHEYEAQLTPNKVNAPASLSKKNRHYYSKEFKKLTNVVRNTVQDHINAAGAGEDDDIVNSISGAKLRDKIAKYSETHNPFEVETLDLEVLVKNHVHGKTLIRLFHGVKISAVASGDHGLVNSSSQLRLDKTAHLRRPHNSRYSSLSKLPGYEYTFISLRDRIAHNHETLNPNIASSIGDMSRYSRGLNKVRLGLLKKNNRRPIGDFTPTTSRRNSPERNERDDKDTSMISHSLVDSLLQLPNENESSDSASVSSTKSCPNAKKDLPLEVILSNLNRRNSYPFNYKNYEMNLNMLAASQLDDINNDARMLDKNLKRARSKSCSELDDFLLRYREEPLDTLPKFSDLYLKNLNDKIKFDTIRKFYDTDASADACTAMTNGNIRRKYKVLNLELQRLSNAHRQMTTNKAKVMDDDLSQNLQYQLRSLKGALDRLIYETRIVHKRVNELQDTSKSFAVNVKAQQSKLNSMIQTLIKSNKFFQAFTAEERSEICLKLTSDKNQVVANSTPTLSDDCANNGIIAMLLIFVYNAITCFFQFIHFDTSKMNLDRIRNVWNKLDPNRKVIDRAYTIIGRSPSYHESCTSDVSVPTEKEDDESTN